MPGQPGHNTRPHARLPPSFLGMDALMTSQLTVALYNKLLGSLMCLAYLLTCYLLGFAQPGIRVDVRSTGAGIKYLHCNYSVAVRYKWLR